LRLIVSSATLDALSFLDYFTANTVNKGMPHSLCRLAFAHCLIEKEATIISLEGRMYPVEVAYLQEPTPDYVRKAAEVAWEINLQVSLSIA
jgi:ATP-dependent RNA helicase DDX35